MSNFNLGIKKKLTSDLKTMDLSSQGQQQSPNIPVSMIQMRRRVPPKTQQASPIGKTADI